MNFKRLYSLALALCVSAASWAIDIVDGVYQIGTVEDFATFAELLNSGVESKANAVLTADINLGSQQIHIKNLYGKFDGQGHSITVNYVQNAENNGALINYVECGAEVCNLITRGNIESNAKFAAGICNGLNGYIHNCASFIKVQSNGSGDMTHAGIAAVVDGGAVINCLSAMKINGTVTKNCGAICGWLAGRTMVRNNLSIAEFNINVDSNSGSITRNPGQVQNNNESKGHYKQNFFLNAYGNTDHGQKITTEQLASGEVCYRLNAGMEHPQWFQKEGDPYPMPFQYEGATTVGASVAANCMVTDLASDATFTFGGGMVSTKHEIFHGRCLHCGYFPIEDLEFAKSGRGLVLRTPDDVNAYNWMLAYCGDKEKVTLGADIDLGDMPYFSNCDNWFNGEFDGQGHTLTIAISDHTLEGIEGEWAYTSELDKSVDPLGFRAQPYKKGNNCLIHEQYDNGKVHDLYLHGTIETQGSYAGSITNHLRDDRTVNGPRIYNVYSDVTINSTFGGDCIHGGIIGALETANSITNVVFAGKIDANGLGSGCGGLVGICYAVLQVSNSLMIGEMVNINGNANGNNVIGRNPDKVQITGPVYYSLDGIQIEAGIPSGIIKEIEDPNQLTDGSLTYILNNNSSENVIWTQTLGVDKCPVPLPSHGIVYAVPSAGFRCDGLPMGDITYTNEYHEVIVPDHEYEDGFCHTCGQADFDFLHPNEDGIYEIGTAAQLANFSQMVDQLPEMVSASFILTEDINMGEEVEVDGEPLTYSELFLPIGKEGKTTCWRGTADGQLHPISNLNINFPARRGVGFFGVVGTDDAAHPVKIENFIMDNTCTINGAAYIGLIGMSENLGAGEANKIIMNNIGVECSSITGSGANVSGVMGCCMGSDAWFEINNCYVAANRIKGGSESAVLSGWFGHHATVKSCWAISKVDGIQSEDKYFGRFGTNPTLIDCYSLYGTQVPKLKEEDLTSGKLAWDLNGHTFANPAWFQNLEEGDPYPTVKAYQGSVYYLDGKYNSATDEQTSDAAAAIVEFEDAALEELICQKATIEYMKSQLAAFGDCQTMNQLGTLYDAYDRDSLKKSVDAYAAYKATIDDVSNKLENEYSTLEGEDVDALKAYLATAEENVYEAGEMDAAEIKAESAKVYSMLDLAIRTCYGPGYDITDLMTNADFSKNLEGWTFENNQTPSVSRVVNIEDEVCYGIEFWAKEFNMHQTIEGLKPGVYEFTMSGAYRPSDNIYSYNHAAYIYANGMRNYIMTSGEDMLPKGKEINGLNAYINAFTTDKTYSGTYDFCYFSDPQANVETSSEKFETMALGSITRNPVGMALAGKAGRYVNKVLAVVGEDGKLTFGACNPGTKTGSDGTLLANAKLKYLGSVEEADLTEAYASMVARATSVVEDYNMEIKNLIAVPGIPNFANELRDALVAGAAAPASLEAAQALSQLFADIYDCKQAYKQAYLLAQMLSVVSETDCFDIPEGVEPLFTEDELADLGMKSSDLFEAYFEGSMTLGEVKNLPVELQSLGVPAQDEDGVYQAGNAKNLLFVAAKVAQDSYAEVVLTSDIDMAGVNFPGIGTRRVGHNFHGSFDGQGHKISNLWVNDESGDQGVGFVGSSGNLVFKNVHLDKTCTIQGDHFVGLIGEINTTDYTLNIANVQSEATIIAINQNAGGILGCAANGNCTIDNCFTSGYVKSAKEGGGITGWLGNNAKNWLHNSLSIAQVVNGEALVRHGDNTTTSNNFTLDKSITGASGTKGATVVSADLLASGEVAYKLNGSKSEDVRWFQTIGTDKTPTLFDQTGVVYYAGGKYSNDEPYTGLNAFAYDVKVKSNAEQVEVIYTLNADAKAVNIIFKSAGETIANVSVGEEDLTVGEHTIAIANTEIAEAGTEVTFEVEVTPIEVLDPHHVADFQKFVSPYGLAINNVPASAGFGQIYVTNSKDASKVEGLNPADYFSEGNVGLYAFKPDFEVLTEKALTGGLELIGTEVNYDYDPRAIRVTEDGRIFIARTVACESPILEVDAADLEADWKPVFQGGSFDETDGVVYVGEDKMVSSVISFDVDGKGEDLKIAALMCNNAFKQKSYDAADTWTGIYNLGTATSWTTVPSADIPALDGLWTITPATVHLIADHNGGYWYTQYRSNPNETNPAIKHVGADGEIDYSNTTSAMPGAAIAVTADGKTVAMITATNEITIYDTDYKRGVTNQISLVTRRKFTSTAAGKLQGMAFDYAGNLYTSDSSIGTIDVFSLPAKGGVVTPVATPSVDTFKIGDNYTGIEDVKVVGPMAKGYIYNMAGQRQSKMQRGVNIVNGQKILK